MKKQAYIVRNEDFRRRLIALIGELDLTKPKQVVISDYVKRRGLSQNSLMWVWLHEIADDTGHTADECHEIFKRMFLEPQTMEMGGTVVDIPPSTTKLTTTEFTDYLTRIQAFAGSELGLMLSGDSDTWAA